ncbi:unnamed protein product [Staurois parvus]|uniref:Uncharacterized protein n=1 Tax=Staurois parvus TaxID=386267 RepID=A0ABN9B8F0_9NEOB|nr:unnamed protein product [Staurois parvus]
MGPLCPCPNSKKPMIKLPGASYVRPFWARTQGGPHELSVRPWWRHRLLWIC